MRISLNKKAVSEIARRLLHFLPNWLTKTNYAGKLVIGNKRKEIDAESIRRHLAVMTWQCSFLLINIDILKVIKMVLIAWP